MAEPLHLSPVQQALAIVGALGLLALVLRLIYVRRLREDYAALWLVVGLLSVLFAVWQDGLRLVAGALQTETLTAPIFLLSILFLAVIAIHYSVRLSELSDRLRTLTQRIAILDAESPRDDLDVTKPDGKTDERDPSRLEPPA